jgi:hypothetical protein
MDIADHFVELPLQVKDDGIYYYRQNEPSGPSATADESVAAGAEAICIWRRNQPFVVWSEDRSWKELADVLLRNGSKVDEKKLVDLIQANGGYENGAQHLAAMSNTPRLKLKTPESSPDMLYQQLVFPPLSGLFYSFDPDLYAADAKVYTGIFTYRDRLGNPTKVTRVKPDVQAALGSCDVGAQEAGSQSDRHAEVRPHVVNLRPRVGEERGTCQRHDPVRREQRGGQPVYQHGAKWQRMPKNQEDL